MTKNNGKFVILLLFSLFCAFLTLAIFIFVSRPSFLPTLYKDDVPKLSAHSVLEKPVEVVELWLKNDVQIGPSVSSWLTAGQGMAFFMGINAPTSGIHVWRLDSVTGIDKGVFQAGYKSALYYYQGLLYIGDSFGTMRAFDPENNQLVWDKTLNNLGDITGIAGNQQKISINGEMNDSYLLTSRMGELIQTPNVNCNYFYVATEDAVLSRCSPRPSIALVKLASGERVWETEIPENFSQVPVIADQVVLIRTYGDQGNIYALDLYSGKVLWKYRQAVISNIAVSNQSVFFLTKDGSVKGIATQEGNEIIDIRFSSAPFIDLGVDRHKRGYHVAVDKEKSILLVYLGDSLQLFGFSLNGKGDSQ